MLPAAARISQCVDVSKFRPSAPLDGISVVSKWLLLGIVVGGLLSPRVTEACSAVACLGGGAALPAEGVPANTPGMLLRPVRGLNMSPSADTSAFRWLSTSSTSSAGLTSLGFHRNRLDVLAAVDGTFVPGETYTLIEPASCSGAVPFAARMTFTATTAVPLPSLSSSLTLTVGPLEARRLALPESAGCSGDEVRPMVPLTIQVPSDWASWQGMTHRDIYVDGGLWNPPTHIWRQPLGWMPPFARCSNSQLAPHIGLAPGPHTVRVRLTLPGHGMIESPALPFDLDCAIVTGARDAGVPDTSTADLGPSDLGTTLDAGTPADTGTLASAGSMDSLNDGGCRTSGAQPSNLWGLLAGCALFARRRRRSSGHVPQGA